MQDNQLLSNAIDSLENNLNTINIALSELKTKNQVLSDSVKILHESIAKAGIKTEFYSDQLNFQLFWFSIFLAVVGLVSWRTIFKPIEKRIDEIKTDIENINNVKLISLKTEIVDLLEKTTTSLENEIYDLSLDTYKGIYLGLDSLKEFFKLNRNWPMYVLYKMRIIERHFIEDNFDDTEANKKIIEDLKDLLYTIEGENINLSNLKSASIEIINIFSKILNQECHHEIKSISQDILSKINFIEPSPITAFDADASN